MLSPPLLADTLAAKARQLGFELFGIAPAHDSAHADYLRRWIANGRHGQMTFLAERLAERLSPATFLPGCKTALCVALNYHVPLEPPPTPAPGQTLGRIARYALGEDYHEPIKTKLYALADYTRQLAPGSQTRCGVDTAPIPERELAARAGLGWIGKNTCLIHPRLGSWLFLGVVLTTLDLPTTAPLHPAGHCGTCTRCLDACPTDALHPDRPYQLDASQCIAYLTIEHPGDFPPHLAPAMGNWLYGCDICQDVCPYNAKAPPANTHAHPFLRPRLPTAALDAHAVTHWTDTQWHPFSRRTAIRRLGLPLFQRNARQVIENTETTPTPCAPDAPQ